MEDASPKALTEAGLAALRQGDAARAHALFGQIAELGASPPWLAMARACHLLGDTKGEEEALSNELRRDKRDLAALLAMGALKARQKDKRAAGSFFKTALNVASVRPPPSQLQPLLQQAAAFIENAKKDFEAYLADQIASAGLTATNVSPRTRQALDLLLGKTQLYLQQPNMFYFPGLPQRQFYEREEFDWVAGIEADFVVLKEELSALLASKEPFGPYITGSPGRPAPNNALLNDPSWGAYYLWQNGRVLPESVTRCPRTIDALARAPMPVIEGRSPVAMYSLLKPGTHIAPHNGMLNTRLICHMPLIAPEDCALRVGSETRSWHEGQMLIFDDSFEHEAWNRSDRNRIVLLFEIWRPEINEAERAELKTLFDAVSLMPAGDETVA